jgi:phage terminase small subunit
MAKDLNPRQLRFIDHYIKTGNQSRSYMLAGYEPKSRNALDANASQLVRNPKIAAEIGRRKRALIKRNDVTLDKLLAELAEDRALARSLGQPGAAIQATQLTARLVGLLVDRKQTGSPGDFAHLSTPAEVVDAIRKELGEEAAVLLEQLTTDQPEDRATAGGAGELGRVGG